MLYLTALLFLLANQPIPLAILALFWWMMERSDRINAQRRSRWLKRTELFERADGLVMADREAIDPARYKMKLAHRLGVKWP